MARLSARMKVIMKAGQIIFLMEMLAMRLGCLETNQERSCNSPQFLELGKSGTINCSFHRDFVRVLWYNTTEYLQTDPILHYGKSIKTGLGYESGEFDVYPNGSLIINEVSLEHDRTFKVAYVLFENIEPTLIDVEIIVLVFPVPPHPVVVGCAHQPYCVLEAEREGSLTCTVNKIRPQVQLEWKAFYNNDAASISFTNQKMTVNNKGDTFNVIYWTQYRVHLKKRARLTIECKVSNEFFSGLSTKMDLLLLQDNVDPTNETDIPSSKDLSQLPFILVCVAVLLYVAYSCGKRVCKNGRSGSWRNTESNEESTGMLSFGNSGHQTLKELKDYFLKEIKEKYKDLYDAVQPIPYIKDKMYCVDKVFVEGGIEFLESLEGQRELWKRLETYQDVFSSPCVKSRRRILEGEPGYGKSTVTLQLAYDWCNSRQISPLKNVEILILLRLRQLGGVPSIYQAIKRFILPRDTRLSERDIDTILHGGSSVVVILDGFDEYPDRDSTTITDITTIITRQMFQSVDVITTTRSSFLPKKYSPITKRIRLTGFDANARRYYIRKAVVGENNESVRKIEGYLEENPIISDLCQVPLLFVIFAHMTHESKEFRKINSVTSLFCYMIRCFHSHLRNKTNDENVCKYETFETVHHELDRVAFEALCGNSQKIVWKKEELCQLIGHEFYQQYVRIGILVEEEVIDDPGAHNTDYFHCMTEVRFYHKLFCEWYAAHHLCEHLQQNPNENLQEYLQHLNPVDVQYVYRFACGLSSDCYEKIINYLKTIEGGEKFAILCIMEQNEKVDQIKITIRQLCKEGVIISGHESILLQRSSLQLLEIAARNDIHIKVVDLNNCLKSVDLSKKAIILQSGLLFTSRIPTEELGVSITSREITEEEAFAVLKFSSMCASLQKLVYYGCVPPQSLKDESTLSALRSRTPTITIGWRLFDHLPLYVLNLTTGRWENENDRSEPTEAEFEDMRLQRARKREQRTIKNYRDSVNNFRETLRKEAEEQQAKKLDDITTDDSNDVGDGSQQ